MVARLSDALSAYATAATRSTGPGLEARDKIPGETFRQLLRDLFTDAVDAGRQGHQISTDAMVGKAHLPAVVLAINNAEVSLHAVVATPSNGIQAHHQTHHIPHR